MASSADAQRRFGGGGFGGACSFSWDNENYFISPFFRGNPEYDGRVTFARIQYQGAYECGGEGPGWSHDYPRTESHFVRIMRTKRFTPHTQSAAEHRVSATNAGSVTRELRSATTRQM